MASLIYLDTHAVAWLYAGDKDLFPATILEVIGASDDIRISPMVRLELRYLYEIGRVSAPPAPVLDELASALGLVICETAFSAVVLEAEGHSWTRDPFDRLIVAQASLHGAPLVTKDMVIHEHYPEAVW